MGQFADELLYGRGRPPGKVPPPELSPEVQDGVRIWRASGGRGAALIDRSDGPAIEISAGASLALDCPGLLLSPRPEPGERVIGPAEIWVREGLIHRDDDKPAFITLDRLQWFRRGRHHRDGDQPAVCARDRSLPKLYYRDGALHRDFDRPAVINDNEKRWYQNGKLHRLDAPAVIRKEGRYTWAIEGAHLGTSFDSREIPECYRDALASHALISGPGC